MCSGSAPRRTHPCCGIVHSEAVEDYLKAAFRLTSAGQPTTTTAVAEQLGVAPPTATAMLKRLGAAGLTRRLDDHGVELTGHGLRHALAVVRRHRLAETFLATVLDVPWDEVHAEAEVLEHGLSDRLVERIADYLGHPTHDPHGDPIPPAAGTHHERWAAALTHAAAGGRPFLVERVSDRDSAALRYLGELGIRPGVQLRVLERAPFGGPLWVELGAARHGLGTELTDLVHGRSL